MPSIYDDETGEPRFILSEFDEEVIDVLEKHFNRFGFEFLDIENLRAVCDGTMSIPMFRAGLRHIIRLNIIERVTSGETNYELTPEGAELLHERARKMVRTKDISKAPIPAADRFVARSDNEEAASQAEDTLSRLSERIGISNELIASPEERTALSKEISSIREIIEQKSIRIATVWNAITGPGVLRWLAERAADASINALALEAIKHLSKICGF